MQKLLLEEIIEKIKEQDTSLWKRKASVNEESYSTKINDFKISIKRKENATDKELADATRASNIINQQRNDLIQSVDEKINHMVKTGELQKLYSQGTLKMYGKEK